MKCKLCDAEVPDADDKTLAKHRWGWTLAPDSGLVENCWGWWYACPEHSDEDMKDAFAFARARNPR